MIPLGTGIMKLLYNPKTHNQYKNMEVKGSYESQMEDIIEKKLRDKNVSKTKYNEVFKSNLVDLIS